MQMPDFSRGHRWLWWVLIAWTAFVVGLVIYRWGSIVWFSFPDTDDNMRMVQVRGLIHGQGWYDLRNYRLDPPNGANIHWSRLVDLPIAGLILGLRPFFGGVIAEKAAVAAAPLIALLPGLFGLTLIARRLVGPWSMLLAAAILGCANTALLMWMPLRIDHHGWQLSFLILMLAGAADPKPARGGAIAGLMSAASLVIGLEFVPYLTVTGLVLVLRWVMAPEEEAARLRAYGFALAGGTALGFALFASNDNRIVTCDALSPVYLSAMLAAGGIGIVLSGLPLKDWQGRLAAAVAGGALLAVAFALSWPECLGRPERITPSLDRYWFQYIKEARPLWSHGYKVYVPTITLPIIGALCSPFILLHSRGTPQFRAWLSVVALSLASCGLLMWQTRVGPAAQVLAVPGATWLGWQIIPWAQRQNQAYVRVLGSFAGFFVASGLLVSLGVQSFPEKKTAAPKGNERPALFRYCQTLPSLRPIAQLPAQTIMTHVDLAPRLITVTHHSAIAGPYHRNGPAILDVLLSFRDVNPEHAHEVMRRHGATLLLLCPGIAEATIYAKESPNGFYKQLITGKVPAWLSPMPLPKGSPFLLWRRVD
jgi:hypothetical protein